MIRLGMLANSMVIREKLKNVFHERKVLLSTEHLGKPLIKTKFKLKNHKKKIKKT